MEIRSYGQWNDFDAILEEEYQKQAERVRRHQFDMVHRTNELIADLCQAATPEQIVDILADNEERVLLACEEISRIKKRQPIGFC